MKILVIEDDPDLLSITAKRIERLGFTVLEAENLSTATELFEQSKDELVAVVSDLFIHNENGIDFYEQIKAELGAKPFILTTGDQTGDPRVLMYLAQGKNFFCLEKPYTAGKLLKTFEDAKVKTA